MPESAVSHDAISACPKDAAQKREEYRQKVAGINIDANSLLSTDYFNTFNSVIMVLDMLPDVPDMLEEIEQWRFLDYTAHFKESGLDFANLAIEAYAYAPPKLREAFERKANGIRIIIEYTAHILRQLLLTGETQAFANIARSTVIQLRAMIEEGNGIVHGGGTMDQSEIDMFF